MKFPTNIIYSDWPNEIDGMPEQLEKGDLILVTHSHKDHCKRVTIDRLKKERTVILAPKRAARIIDGSRIVTAGDEISYGNITIKVIDAYNIPEGHSTRKVHHKGDGVGYLVRTGRNTIYHAGDTDFIPEMRELGRVDAAMLPIGGTFTMDIAEAIEAAKAISPVIVIPMHRKDADPAEFRRNMESSCSIDVAPLKTGETVKLK